MKNKSIAQYDLDVYCPVCYWVGVFGKTLAVFHALPSGACPKCKCLVTAKG